MITFMVTPEDLLNLRFAYSPMFEVVGSFRVLKRTDLCANHFGQWADSARRALQDIELPYMTDIMRCNRYVPDFFNPFAG